MSYSHRIQKRNKCKIQMVRALSNSSIGSCKIDDEINEKNKTIIEEFCQTTTVHGIRYFSGKQYHWIERVWWMGSFALSVVLCVIAISSVWARWSDHPVTVIFDDKRTTISEIPFPAVTICTTQKFDGHYSDADERLMENLFEHNIRNMDAVAQLCSKLFGEFHGKRTTSSENISIYESIKQMSPPIISSSDLFGIINFRVESAPIFTNEGLCFTLNAINSHELYTDVIAPELLTVRDNLNATHWNVENGYRTENISEIDLYPYRVFRSDMINSMYIKPRKLLKKMSEICDSRFPPGFMLSLHMPDELPEFNSNFMFIPSEYDAFILVEPKKTVTSEGLREYAPHTKGCFFKSERQLRFFKTYSQRKCEMECLVNYMKQICECVRFWMPRDNDTKVCRYFEISCCAYAETKFTQNIIVKQCDCLPDCVSIDYNMEHQSFPSKSDNFSGKISKPQMIRSVTNDSMDSEKFHDDMNKNYQILEKN